MVLEGFPGSVCWWADQFFPKFTRIKKLNKQQSRQVVQECSLTTKSYNYKVFYSVNMWWRTMKIIPQNMYNFIYLIIWKASSRHSTQLEKSGRRRTAQKDRCCIWAEHSSVNKQQNQTKTKKVILTQFQTLWDNNFTKDHLFCHSLFVLLFCDLR